MPLLTSLTTHQTFRPKEISKFPGAISNLKVKQVSDETFAIACSALVTPSGVFYNPESEKKPLSSARVYTSLFARHWDSWVTENRNAIFYGSLKKKKEATSSGDLDLILESPGLTNVLANTSLQSPVPPFGGASDFDLSATGLVFVARDPTLSEATHTKSDLYFVALPQADFTRSPAPRPQLIRTGHLHGYSAAPVFNHAGTAVAFTRMRHDQYESDKPHLLLVPDIVHDPANVQEFYATPDGEGGWDRRPDAVVWSADDKVLYVLAEDEGRAKVFRLPSEPRLAHATLPEVISQGVEGSIGDVRLFGRNGKLFTSASSLTDSSFYTVLSPSGDSDDDDDNAGAPATLLSSNSKQGRTFGLSRSQVSEICFDCGGKEGSESYKVHAWVLKPSTFSPDKKYPLAMLIHGGPQSAWGDSWSTRWNPAVFAEQGYIAVMPNPTGSTGYGMALQNGIRAHWGGRPYEDLVACWDYLASSSSPLAPNLDLDHAVALGASYGGFMVNWIQGHELGRRFKALVCHDGVFSTLNQYASEELFFPIHDFGGELWKNREGYEKWDPARFVGEWATPQLVSLAVCFSGAPIVTCMHVLTAV